MGQFVKGCRKVGRRFSEGIFKKKCSRYLANVYKNLYLADRPTDWNGKYFFFSYKFSFLAFFFLNTHLSW